MTGPAVPGPAVGCSSGLGAWVDPASWPQRLARAAAFALVSVTLAVGAHRLAGGMNADWRVSAAGLVALFTLGVAMTGRERGGRLIGVTVLGSQTLLHATFSSAAHHAMSGPSPVSRWASILLCVHGAQPASLDQVNAARALMDMSPLTASSPAPMSSMPDTVSAAGSVMLAAHLVAALATAWWLRRGERTAWSLIGHVVATIVQVLAPPPPCPTTARPATAPIWIAGPRIWASAVAGRGPPSAVVVWPITA